MPDNQKHTKKHIYLLKNCYLCIISTFCGNDTQTFYNCLRRGFRRGASCICISIKKKAISERYTIKTASRLLQNDIACPADRGGSPTMRTNPGNKMTKRTSRQRTTFFFFFPKHWFISLVATVITRLQSGESVCDVVGLVATVSIAG